MIMQILIAYYFYVSAGDLVLTIVGLKWGFTEANPIMAKLTDSIWAFSAIKIIGMLFAMWLAWRMWNRWPSTKHRIFSFLVFAALVALQTYATVHNLRRLLGY